MKKAVLVGVTLLGLVVLVGLAMVGIGALLPQDHVASRSVRLAQPPEALWEAIAGFENHPTWRKDVSSMERLPDRDGRPVWRETNDFGPLTYEVTVFEPPTRLVTRIADPDLPFGGTWTYEIVPGEGGATVTITERGSVYNPVFRFVSRFVMGHRATMDRYLRFLGERFGEEVELGGA